MELRGRRVAVLAETLYEDLELWYPILRLQEAGAEVVVIGPRAGETYSSKHGYPVRADLSAAEARADDFDALIIPGGYAPDHMRRHPEMISLVRQVHDQGKIVAAICHAGWMLASANVVQGRTVTGYFSIKDDLVNAGARYVDEEVVRDGNLITSRFPGDLPAFLREIVGALREATAAVGARS